MGEATPTDPRAQRNRAGRRGGHLLTRALSPPCNTGLPTLLHSRRPCPGRSHRRPNTCAPPGRGNSGTGDAEIFIPATNGIESLNARFRQAIRRRGHFPTEQAAMKILYLTVRERRPNRSNPTGRIPGWKSILNTLAITYGDRLNIN
jgi:Transposase, Mutator family